MCSQKPCRPWLRTGTQGTPSGPVWWRPWWTSNGTRDTVIGRQIGWMWVSHQVAAGKIVTMSVMVNHQNKFSCTPSRQTHETYSAGNQWTNQTSPSICGFLEVSSHNENCCWTTSNSHYGNGQSLHALTVVETSQTRSGNEPQYRFLCLVGTRNGRDNFRSIRSATIMRIAGLYPLQPHFRAHLGLGEAAS